ncbi:MAG: hypothetical protein K2Q12_05815 [Rickettsiales bacterium]|nr:hypothetical protein [Rickettsiales bacterium]
MSGDLETEYKFLVKNDDWKAIAPSAVKNITQHYFPKTDDEIAPLNLKINGASAAITVNFSGQETILPIPQDVLEAFGVDNLRKITNEHGEIIIDEGTEARIRNSDGHYVLTIKAKTENIASRRELEFPISKDSALKLITHCPHSLAKIRHVLDIEGKKWEVDVFQGKNTGLVTAEIETDKIPDNLPDWIGKNITGIEKYSNQQLAKIPYSLWGRDDRGLS